MMYIGPLHNHFGINTEQHNWTTQFFAVAASPLMMIKDDFSLLSCTYIESVSCGVEMKQSHEFVEWK